MFVYGGVLLHERSKNLMGRNSGNIIECIQALSLEILLLFLIFIFYEMGKFFVEQCMASWYHLLALPFS